MSDLNIYIRLDADPLCAAILRLADALSRPVPPPLFAAAAAIAGHASGAGTPASVPPSAPSAEPQPAASVPEPVLPAPVQPIVPTAPVQPAAPTAPPAPAQPLVPTAPPRQYELAELQVAAGALCDAGRRDALLALLKQFEVRAMSELRAEQYGAFATALRGLGAKL